MKRVWKNIVCGTGLVLLAGSAVATGMDVFGEDRRVGRFEERDWSFGGFDDDEGFFFDEDRNRESGDSRRYSFDDEDDFFDDDRFDDDFFDDDFCGEQGGSGDRNDTRIRNGEDSTSGATDNAGSGAGNDTGSDRNAGNEKADSGKSDAADSQSKDSGAKAASVVSLMMESDGTGSGTLEKPGGWMPSNDRRHESNGYGIFVFILELAGFALLTAWMIASRANRLTWSQVVHRTPELPSEKVGAGTVEEAAAKTADFAEGVKEAEVVVDEPVETVLVEEVKPEVQVEQSQEATDSDAKADDKTDTDSAEEQK
ncbi:hypothetical protein [Faecalibaculum rodentium]|uniref:hypothetical protein n=1 Tax=Faecalibaculum rodentium TaxID=1702221 RepID=UPI002626093C|nr:hypothetical protein [Faecalibaculum rodentium]